MINTKKPLKPIDKEKTEAETHSFQRYRKKTELLYQQKENHWQPKILRQANYLSIESEIKTIFR